MTARRDCLSCKFFDARGDSAGGTCTNPGFPDAPIPVSAMEVLSEFCNGFAWKEPAGVGDVTSDKRGSGARFNAGKAALELIPLDIIANAGIIGTPSQEEVAEAMRYLGLFQRRSAKNDTQALYRALIYVGATWEDIAAVFDYGRKKYADWNWAKGFNWSVPIACAARHLLAILKGEETDPESGLPHRAHVGSNLVMLLTFIETYPEGDDRTDRLRPVTAKV